MTLVGTTFQNIDDRSSPCKVKNHIAYLIPGSGASCSVSSLILNYTS
jgi:hypothetical protein